MPLDERWYGLGDFARLINLEGVEFREYQFNIINAVLKNGNSLVVLPTGLGKTLIGVALIAKSIFEGKRALLLAPTKPLAEQHHRELTRLLNIDPDEIALLIGTVGKKDRQATELKAGIIVATPQTIANDLKSGNFSLGDFGIAVFDECHRAVGKYAYTYIANELAVHEALIVGLTASPGSRKDKVGALVGTLNVRHIEARISTDPDVLSYVMPKYVHVVRVPQTDRIREIAALLKPLAEESLRSLNGMGLMRAKDFESIPKGRLIMLGNEINRISAQGYRFGAFFSYIKLLNTVHAYDLLLTEGIYPFHAYVTTLREREKKSRAVENLLASRGMVHAMQIAEQALRNGEEHPKVDEAVRVIRGSSGEEHHRLRAVQVHYKDARRPVYQARAEGHALRWKEGGRHAGEPEADHRGLQGGEVRRPRGELHRRGGPGHTQRRPRHLLRADTQRDKEHTEEGPDRAVQGGRRLRTRCHGNQGRGLPLRLGREGEAHALGAAVREQGPREAGRHKGGAGEGAAQAGPARQDGKRGGFVRRLSGKRDI